MGEARLEMQVNSIYTISEHSFTPLLQFRDKCWSSNVSYSEVFLALDENQFKVLPSLLRGAYIPDSLLRTLVGM